MGLARRLGIIGGGQLGMMIAEAASKMPSHISGVSVLDPSPNCPASQAGARQITGGFGDRAAIEELASCSDVMTYEIESGDAGILESLQDRVQISPSPRTLRIIQDKYAQKKFLSESGIPVGEFAPVQSAQDALDAAEKFGYPVVLKAKRGAYDGRGNALVKSAADVGPALERFEGRQVYVEKLVPYDMEVSVIAARSTAGQIASYPLVENVHEEGVLRTTVAPARAPEKVAQEAGRIAAQAMDVLKGAGVFGIEMFAVGSSVLVNEIAPRVHNSGHHTLQSSATSQFEQHLRAILGLELGPTDLLRPTVMCNILGPKSFSGPYRRPAVSGSDAVLKMYNKAESRPLRKLGHLNYSGSGDPGQMIRMARAAVQSVRIEPA